MDIYTLEEYRNGAERNAYNALIYESIQEYVALIDGETSPYRISLIYHDKILSECAYAYDASGEPESASWAHNILGPLTKNLCVCEGYAEFFHLLCNVSGVECMQILGEAGEYHDWNLVRMDDGNWYWFDLTWDDPQAIDGDLTGKNYLYFCRSDTDFLSFSNLGNNSNGNIKNGKTFLNEHTPDTYPNNSKPNRVCYVLPETAQTAFDPDNLITRADVFTVDGYSYLMITANEVVLVKIEGHKNAVVPTRVPYQSHVYNVVGAYGLGEYSDYLYEQAYVTTDAETVTLPFSLYCVVGEEKIRMVGAKAFKAPSVKEVIFAEQTPSE